MPPPVASDTTVVVTSAGRARLQARLDRAVDRAAQLAARIAADAASISIDSPLSQALLGRRPGDHATVEAPAGSYTCIIRARRRAR